MNERELELDVNEAMLSIPLSFRWAKIGAPDFVPPRVANALVIQDVTALAEAKPIDVVLRGVSGIGKTSTAAALFHAWATRSAGSKATRNRSRFFSARTLSTMRDRVMIAEAMSAPLIVLDDLGAEDPHPSSRHTLGAIIAERHAWARPTIFTTALAVESACEFYGDGIARRLFERTTIFTWSRA